MTGTSTPAPAPTGDEPDVLVSRHGRLGHIQLNRPRAMNALTLPMVEAIASALATWAEDDSVEAALISGAGDRGLCAGGDVVTVRREALEDGPEVASRFWAAEYAMNLAIAEYPKPIVALMDGIVLGGGVGVSSHAGIRIVTDRSRVGMPETGIGLFPDVGGTYLLSRAPLYRASAWWRVGIAYAGLMSIAGASVWDGHPGAITRVVLPLTVAFNMVVLREARFWPLVVAGNLPVLVELWP